MRNVIMGITVAAALVFAQPATADTVSDWWEFANKLAPPAGPAHRTRCGPRRAPLWPCSRR